MALHERAGCGLRVSVPRVAEAFLVGRETQQALEQEAGPAGIALGRHEEEVAAWLEHAHHLGDEGFVVLDVLEEVDRGYHVEGRGRERELPVADL